MPGYNTTAYARRSIISGRKKPQVLTGLARHGLIMRPERSRRRQEENRHHHQGTDENDLHQYSSSSESCHGYKLSSSVSNLSGYSTASSTMSDREQQHQRYHSKRRQSLGRSFLRTSIESQSIPEEEGGWGHFVDIDYF